MTNKDNIKVRNVLVDKISRYPTNIRAAIDIKIDNESYETLKITTNFGEPHLDISIILDNGEFTVYYPNNYGEHWYKNKTNWEVIANDIYILIDELIHSGALRIDKIRNKQLYSSTIRIGTSENTTDLKKISIFPKQNKIYTYPPVLSVNNK
jgi:phage pi2 protein 07